MNKHPIFSILPFGIRQGGWVPGESGDDQSSEFAQGSSGFTGSPPRFCKKLCNANILKNRGPGGPRQSPEMPSLLPWVISSIPGSKSEVWEMGLREQGKMPQPHPTPPLPAPSKEEVPRTPLGTLRLCLLDGLKSASSLTSSHTESAVSFGGEWGERGRKEA